MTLLDEKIHLLETQKHDATLEKNVTSIINKYETTISASLSAFFVAHSIDGLIDSTILSKPPKTNDISKLKHLMEHISKNGGNQVNKRKLAYVSLGLADMELYMQSMVGLVLLPLGMDLYEYFINEISSQFEEEYHRQQGDHESLQESVVRRLSQASFNNLKPEQSFWKSFDLIVTNLSLEIIKAVKQGVNNKEWQRIVGG